MNRRDQIKLTDAEVEEFLHGRRTMNIATVAKDGRPHLVAMWYGFLEGAPAFETFAKSQKVLNLRRDPRITCLVEEGDAYEKLRGVELIGTGEIVEDEGRLLETAMSVVRRYHDIPEEHLEAAARALMHKRVGVKVNVEKVVSWDHSKLGGELPGQKGS
jgi:PPOX class probable F420-dependent enzyme